VHRCEREEMAEHAMFTVETGVAVHFSDLAWS
jgi:hypothetical protein